MQYRVIHAFWIVALSAACARGASEDGAQRLWSTHIQPLLAENCFKCHGNIETKSGLSVMTSAEVLKGGDNGPAVVPGQPGKSLLYKYLQPDADPHMPPKGKPLTIEEIALIKRWIEKLSPTDAKAANATDDSTSPAGASPLFRKSNWQPPKGMTAPQAIDRLIAQRWRELKVNPSDLCDDRTFARRVYLDIAGRIPAPEELERFLADKRRDKRAALVNALLDSPDYAVRMREVFDVVFMERGAFETSRERRRRGGSNSPLGERWQNYLEWSFRENRPWNVVTREILLARPATNETRGAIQFLYARKDNAQQMAEASGSALLGLQIKCAQCHDHPLAPEIHQQHYWGMVAAFNRSKGVDTAAGSGVAESAIGGFIKFTNLKAKSTDASLTFLDDKTIDESRPKEGEKETDAPGKYVNGTPLGDGKNLKQVPVPEFSRREQFANWLTETNNPLLSRAFVNRVWAMLLGRGLVHPVDRMDSSRPPSHPELLDWLAEDFAQSRYDVKRLIRNITATRVYQLDSQPNGKTRPPADSFACALDKPLSAEVLARSLLIAAGNSPTNGSPEMAQLQRIFAEAFPDVFPTENVSSLRQALFLSNNKTVDAVIKSSETNLLVRVSSLDDRAKAKELFVRALGREPDRDEMKRALAYLQARSEEPSAATSQLLWALLTSAEFRINH